MRQALKRYIAQERGAVTVDWVVLTAAIVALGVAAGSSMISATTDLSDNIWSYMESLNLFD